MADRTRPTVQAGPPGSGGARYDAPRGWPTRVAAVLLAGVSVIAAYAFARPLVGSPQDVRFQVTGYQVLPAGQAVEVRWTVDRPVGERVLCVVRSRDGDGREIGRAEVPVPRDVPGTLVSMTFALATEGQPATGEVSDCGIPSEPVASRQAPV